MKSLYPEWEAEQKERGPQLPARIRTMHKRYGVTPGKTCGQCKACIISMMTNRSYSRNYYKCLLTTITHGAMTDWRVSWPACGKFQDGNEQPGAMERDTEPEHENNAHT